MAVDNSSQGGNDTIRDLARQSGNVKTQTFQLDLGGPSSNAEVLITAGQQVMAASVPVVIAANQTAINVSVNSAPVSSGVWAYDAGVSGTVVVGVGKRVLQITASATLTAGSLTINGGAAITIPAGRALTIEPRGALVAPTIVFTGTDAYFVEEVS